MLNTVIHWLSEWGIIKNIFAWVAFSLPLIITFSIIIVRQKDRSSLSTIAWVLRWVLFFPIFLAIGVPYSLLQQFAKSLLSSRDSRFEPSQARAPTASMSAMARSI